MASLISIHVSFVAYFLAFGFCLIENVNTEQFFCNNHYIESEDDIQIRCFYVSPEPATWSEAHRYCHRNRGWLANNPSQYRSERDHPIGSELLAFNDVYSIWSGLHVQDYKVLEDAFPTPTTIRFITPMDEGNIEEAPFGESFDWKMDLNSRGDCVIEEFYAPGCVTNNAEESDFPQDFTEDVGSGTGSIPQICLNGDFQYRKRFVSCSEKHIFGCYFSGVDLSQEMGVPIELFSALDEVSVSVYDPYFLPVQMYLSSEKSNNSESDDVCGRLLERGTTFQETRRNPIDTLNVVAQVFNTTASPSASEYFTRQLHWIKRNHSNECYATSLTFAYSQTDKKYSVMSWPCHASLPAVCQRDKVYPETTAVMEVTFEDERFRLVGNEVQGPSAAFRDHSLPGVFGDETIKLTLRCSINSMGPGQSLTTYESGVPVQTYTQTQRLRGPYSVDLFRFREAINPLAMLGYHYCEVNNEEDNKLISSNRIFLRPTDIGVYSLHIDIFPNVSNAFVWALNAYSLSNQWFAAFEILPPVHDRQDNSDEGNVFQRLQEIRGTTFFTTPVLFIPGDESHNHSVVFYLYEEATNRDVGEFTRAESESRQKRQTNSTQNEGDLVNPVNEEILADEGQQQFLAVQGMIRNYLIQNTPSLYPFNTTSAKLFSIDYCWTKTVYDNITNRNYTLPHSMEGTVYKSPQTCAQDNGPLVTVECRGDKIVGLNWGPIEVNPLCDYSESDSETDSQITLTLQGISQENITADNVDNYLNDTKVLTSVLTDESVNTKDILYVADILQKSSEIDNLSPEAAKALMDTVETVTKLTPATLTDAQEVGRATNRILQSVDKLGGIVDIGKNTNFQRIISGQYALEVWNLTLDYDDSPIVGLKVLTGGKTKPINNNDMISLFSANTDYDDAEAAILLPKEFIMSILGSDTSNDVKLSMNVYRDTTLYSSSITDSNVTLNSRVIAVQLLLKGQPITDLGSHKVTSVFLPNVEITDERRSELSVCAYWDFNANLGAGGWATDGCEYDRTEDGRDVCVCDHLTNFAVLVNFYSQEYVSDEHQLALSIITIVGLSLSILGLSISIISFLCIKKLRQGRPQQTLFNLALALLLTWIVFLAGIERTESHAGCIAVAAILHYLVVASFMWMLMEGLLQYLLFVRVMNTYFTKYMWKTGIPAWGLPIVPVIIVFAIDPELYDGGEEYCWMDREAFYYAFALPVGLIVLTNLVIFILVVISLCRRKDMSKMSSQSKNKTVVNIRASFICFFVLGLSWVFGFLTIEEARTAFQYIFCILATLQGFIIFLMMTARDRTVQQFWRNLCCRCRKGASKGSGYRTSNDKGGSSQDTHAIPRLQRDKGGDYHGSNSSSNTQMTSNTTLSITEGDSEKNHASSYSKRKKSHDISSRDNPKMPEGLFESLPQHTADVNPVCKDNTKSIICVLFERRTINKK